MATYITSDIHGRYDLYKKMLSIIHLKKDDKLYILGDVVDRGPDPLPILFDILANDDIILLKGNHEQIMLDAIQNKMFAMEMWQTNGGKITKKQFLALNNETKKELEKFLMGLPLFAVVGKNILVHAGVIREKMTNDIVASLKHHSEDELLWVRDEFIFQSANLPKGYKIWFGHTPTALITNAPGRCTVWVDSTYKDKIGIDCGASNNKIGQLACVCLDTKRVIYIK